MTIRTTLICAGLALTALNALPAAAQETVTLKPLSVAMAEGTYAGTFLCSLGEMGMSLTIKDEGPATLEDIAEQPCKSGAGPSNDAQNQRIANRRKTTGVLNFFPTVGNPDAPAGAFQVSGWVDYGSKRFQRMQFNPGAWLDKPDNFGASAMTGTLINGVITGKPTAGGCHALRMRKIQTWSPKP